MMKCIIFDLGDTLIDTSTAVIAANKEFQVDFFREHGYNLTADDIANAFDHVNKMKTSNISDKEMTKRVLKHLGVKWDKKTINDWQDGYYNYYFAKLRLLDGAHEILEYCKKHFKLVLISNGRKERIYNALRHFDLEKHFDIIITSEEFNVKSSLEPFKHLLALIPFKPEECIMVGDRLDEDAYAKKLGMRVVWVQHSAVRDRKYYKETEAYDWRITQLSELKGIISRL
jgi:HAD superfamily hydrolase (TIGR01549 family)